MVDVVEEPAGHASKDSICQGALCREPNNYHVSIYVPGGFHYGLIWFTTHRMYTCSIYVYTFGNVSHVSEILRTGVCVYNMQFTIHGCGGYDLTIGNDFI